MNMGSYQEMCHCYHNYAQPICILHPLYIFSDTTSRVFTAILLIFDNLNKIDTECAGMSRYFWFVRNISRILILISRILLVICI